MQRPNAIVLLPNNIEIDARAQRNGLALHAAGYNVTLVGYGTGLPERGTLAGLPYILCSPPSARRAAGRPKPPSLLYRVVRKLFHVTLRRRPPVKVATAVARVDETAAAVARRADRRVIQPVRSLVSRLVDRKATPTPVGEVDFSWRTALPHVVTMVKAMEGAVIDLDPDLLVMDVHLLPLGVAVAEAQAAKGKRVGLVYDAREYVYGLASDDPSVTRGFPALEAEFIDRMDATVTVCEPIAESLAERYRLPVVPPLVPNAPLRDLPPRGRSLTVRDLVQVGDAPLLVYAGGLSHQRGVHDVIAALPDLPGVHLALGARRASSYTEELEALARKLDVRDRVHFVPFAPTHEVAEFLASATAAVIPFHPVGNHNWAAPNKYFEAVQAGLPILTSNMEWLSERVNTLGIGEVFEHSNPASFAAAARTLLADLDRYRARLTEDVVQAHTFEAIEHVIQDVCVGVTDPTVAARLQPRDLAENLTAIRDDMMRQRAVLADADLFPRRPWLRIGRTNTGGLPRLWGDAVMRHHPRAIVESTWRHKDTNLTFPVDHTVPWETWASPAWQKAMVARVEKRVSHELIESGLASLGTQFGTFFDSELDFYRDNGVKVGLVFHGSDIRNPRVHARLEPDSPFADPNEELTAALQQQVDDMTRRVEGFDGPVFVTTHDLKDYVPRATWLPVVVDVDAWRSETPPLAHGGLPVVFHTPSRRSMKGSDEVDLVCRDLEREGKIRYVSRSGLNRREMLDEMRAADIVVDQLRLGDYGITSVEAMAAGRVVVAHVSDRVRERIGEPLPIVEATVATLRSVLADLADDPARIARLSEEGVAYARRWHDGRVSADVLADFMGL